MLYYERDERYERFTKTKKGVKMKNLLITLFFSITIPYLHAGCGGCGTSRNHDETKKGIVETIPRNNQIKGEVFLSCGMCNFNSKDKDCTLAIKVGRNILPVVGVDIDAHGNSHAKDGYCNVIKKAYVEGRVRGNSFHAKKIDLPSI